MATERREAHIERVTKETRIDLTLSLEGSGATAIDTGIGFFDHMLDAFARHGFLDLKASVKGDLGVDTHHTVEDTGLALGQALKLALGDKKGIARSGFFVMPMDEALVLCALDLSGRPAYASGYRFFTEKCGDFETATTDEFFHSVANAGEFNLHFVVLRGENAHHVIEAMFKAFGRALSSAVARDPRVTGVLSTKGSL